MRTEDDFSGFLFFEELARKLLIEQPELRTRATEFHREIYRKQTARELRAANRSFITDRGTVDAFAFHPETLSDVGTSLELEYSRYNAIIQLGSSAALGEEHYQPDEVRRESPAEAMAIESALKEAWQGHRNYHFVSAQRHFEEKYAEFITLARVLCRSSADV
jgi:predicted ATPase